ncbi:RecQ family ATP-dependent DNA helicase [Alkalibacterium kapii]|uniref:ATP-dependent DNA helicase RecQ n=1 Tax=Alkalibacterium kapii TaxID=426704 RepID=A0A511ATA7_9LACT|nr:RecQ family ATP-dependent DNA helicase [Alkalibacterium kapii]GEK90952.1 ATP-dependent DNA helicase [Alkalibacterium kapii]
MDKSLKSQVYDTLEMKFGFKKLRPGQGEAIEAALTGKNSLVMLPTGTGKTLCYQLPSYLMRGTTLIISPLLSLMEDQVEKMKRNGEKSVLALNSHMSAKEKRQGLEFLHTYKFIYVSPEMLQQKRVVERLEDIEISLLVVDEAHCISQWGMDFRPDYLKIGDLRKQLSEPLTMALTATAVYEVRKEIIENLKLESNIKEVIYSVDRPSIQLRVERCQGDKVSKVIHAVNTFGSSGIIYFSSKKMSEKTAEKIRRRTAFSAESYHSEIETKDKKKIQAQFLANKLDIICATSAFGMGIDKPDIRYIIHYHIPANPEMYLQEIGRASRDKKGGIALLLYEPGDEYLQKRLQEASLPEENELKYAYRHPDELKKFKDDSKLRLAQYFITQKINIKEALKLVEERKVLKNKQLAVMLQYVMSDQCKRELLLNYFGEETLEQQKKCCSYCEENLSLPFEKRGPNLHYTQNKEDWETILNKLFNFNSQP